MDVGSPQDWAQGAGAFKSAIEAFGSLIGIIKDLRGRKTTPEEEAMLDKAIAEAEKAAKIADAQTAKALGYTLCRCQFPPVAMLTVGFHVGIQGREGPVHECPRCGNNTAGIWDYNRIAPPWAPPVAD